MQRPAKTLNSMTQYLCSKYKVGIKLFYNFKHSDLLIIINSKFTVACRKQVFTQKIVQTKKNLQKKFPSKIILDQKFER